MSDFYDGVLSQLTVPDLRLPTFWAQDNVYIEHSERKAGMFDREYAPYLNEPIDCLADPSIFASSLAKPVQSGGTQALEIYSTWAVANVPGPAILTGQTDKDVESIFKDKFLKTLRSSPGTAAILKNLPLDAITRDRLDLPSMAWDIQGPGGNKIHSKTKRYLFCDEVWRYLQGVLNMLLKRADAVTGRKVMCVSQAGEQLNVSNGGMPIWDEWGAWWHSGTQEQFSIACPTCGERFCPETKHFEWDKNEETRDPQTKVWKFKALKKTVRMKCPFCEAEHYPGDTIEERQAFVHKLAKTGIYIPTNNNAREGHRSFRYTIWVVWWKDWGDMVEEYLIAKERLRIGVIEDYKSWIQQREARFWTLKDDEIPVINSRTASGYTMLNYEHKEGSELVKWEKEEFRIQTVDVQANCFKVVIRAWSQDGASRALWQGTLASWDAIRSKQLEYKVPNNLVAVDANDFTQAVYAKCITYNWIAVHGMAAKGFRLVIDGKKIILPFEKAEGRNSFARKDRRVIGAKVFNWSNPRYKDQLSRIISGAAQIKWEFPDDVEQEYIESLESERKNEKGIWERIGKRPNHFWDCENMQLVVASLPGVEIFTFTEQNQVETEVGQSA